jgi:hypothetical protein
MWNYCTNSVIANIKANIYIHIIVFKLGSHGSTTLPSWKIRFSLIHKNRYWISPKLRIVTATMTVTFFFFFAKKATITKAIQILLVIFMKEKKSYLPFWPFDCSIK